MVAFGSVKIRVANRVAQYLKVWEDDAKFRVNVSSHQAPETLTAKRKTRQVRKYLHLPDSLFLVWVERFELSAS